MNGHAKNRGARNTASNHGSRSGFVANTGSGIRQRQILNGDQRSERTDEQTDGQDQRLDARNKGICARKCVRQDAVAAAMERGMHLDLTS
jgi:hypothetical protein